jgi:hypothetical protein
VSSCVYSQINGKFPWKIPPEYLDVKKFCLADTEWIPTMSADFPVSVNVSYSLQLVILTAISFIPAENLVE